MRMRCRLIFVSRSSAVSCGAVVLYNSSCALLKRNRNSLLVLKMFIPEPDASTSSNGDSLIVKSLCLCLVTWLAQRCALTHTHYHNTLVFIYLRFCFYFVFKTILLNLFCFYCMMSWKFIYIILFLLFLYFLRNCNMMRLDFEEKSCWNKSSMKLLKEFN